MDVATRASSVLQASSQLEAVLDDIAGLLGDLIGDDLVVSPVPESTGRWWSQLHQLKGRHGQGLSVALLALAKSGASPERDRATNSLRAWMWQGPLVSGTGVAMICMAH